MRLRGNLRSNDHVEKARLAASRSIVTPSAKTAPPTVPFPHRPPSSTGALKSPPESMNSVTAMVAVTASAVARTSAPAISDGGGTGRPGSRFLLTSNTLLLSWVPSVFASTSRNGFAPNSATPLTNSSGERQRRQEVTGCLEGLGASRHRPFPLRSTTRSLTQQHHSRMRLLLPTVLGSSRAASRLDRFERQQLSAFCLPTGGHHR